MNICQYDLDDVWEDLKGPVKKPHKCTVQCDFCQDTITQEMNVCPSCGAHIVWFESPTWKRLFGKPHEYIRALTSDHLKGVTPLQMKVIGTYGEGGKFRNATQQQIFLRLEKKYPDAFIEHVLLWAQEKRVPWSSFVSAIKNDGWLQQWSEKEMGNEERWSGVSDEAVQAMLG